MLQAAFSRLVYILAGATCSVLLMLELSYYTLSAELWSVKKYGKIFLEAERAARQIDHLLPPGATFYEWGNESGFYFSSRHRPSSGVFLAEPMLAGPLAAKLSRRLIDDLERTKRDLIVVEKPTSRQSTGHPVMNWIEANYRPFSHTRLFLLCARKGSALDQRQHAVAVN